LNQVENFYGQGFQPDAKAVRLDVFNPATGKVIGQMPMASESLALQAVEQARQAQSAWAALAAIERAKALQSLASHIEGHAPQIAEVLALETGKSAGDALAEVDYSVEVLRYHTEWARRLEGEIIPSDNPREQLYLHREPIGVVVALIPFNFPIYTLLRKIAPALITGNTVVVRPSNTTPLSALALAQAVFNAAMPAGVINILAMDHAVCESMCRHPAIGMMSLTGSLTAGREILRYAQHNIAKTSLELGGKTPAIIAADADLHKAATDIVGSRLSHCGQVCTGVARVMVERSVHDQFLQMVKNLMQQKTWGDRSVQHQHMGPLATAAARRQVHSMVDKAVAQGAKLELGGFVPDGPGYFYPPTLLSECRQDMEIIQEEVFGPVMTIMPVDDMAQALAWANDHQYGLASVLYTHRHDTVQMFAHGIEAGELYVNRTPADPYQGYHAGWKRSGLGGDDGKHGMLEFTRTRLVVMPY
jgi:lactaldehyde dehydrogenase/glycolaldehyde dehydrogenase